ncbi:MAG: zinc-ribbon domain-containing protein [Clostridia bacterium]
MICNKCGSELEEGALFCASCGAKVETAETEQTAAAQEASENAQESMQSAAPVNTVPVIEPVTEGQTVSLGNWICRYLINFIPCVGNIIFIVMLFVWSFDKKYDETSRNWAKAVLIFTGISLVLAIIVCAVVFGIIFASNAAYNYHYRIF